MEAIIAALAVATQATMLSFSSPVTWVVLLLLAVAFCLTLRLSARAKEYAAMLRSSANKLRALIARDQFLSADNKAEVEAAIPDLPFLSEQ